MCLILDSKKTEKFLKNPIDVVVYKLLKLDTRGLTSLILSSYYWHPNCNVSNRKDRAITDVEKRKHEIEFGMHSYADVLDARKEYENQSGNKSSVLKSFTVDKQKVYVDIDGYAIVPLYASRHNFVAFGKFDNKCTNFVHMSLDLNINVWQACIKIALANSPALELAKYTKKKNK